MKICFWQITRPLHIIDFFSTLGLRNEVILLYPNDNSVARKKILEKNSIKINNVTEIIYPNDNFNEFVIDVFNKYNDYVHVFSGFSPFMNNIIKVYITLEYKKGFIITELPSPSPSKYLNTIIRYVKMKHYKNLYRKYYREYNNCLLGYFVTGTIGIDLYKSYGIPEDKLFYYMYTHNLNKNIKIEYNNNLNKIKNIRFLYIGRFNFLNRGVDNLIYSFNKLKYDNWSLDLVGGYGENHDEIIKWTNEKENINYIGSWHPEEVVNNMMNYDICISPTRYDGWRIQVNQAITAGIGTITTYEAVSDELVIASQSGIVVNAFKKNELLNALNYVFENPQIINKWKENARNFAPKITNEVYVDYFIDCINYALGNIDKKPTCKWLNEE